MRMSWRLVPRMWGGFALGTTAALVQAGVASAQSSGTALEAGSTPPGSQAQGAPRAEPPSSLARQHFENGVRLYQDGNYTAALVEFQAAFQIKPGAGSLQNIALCQKALFRYAAAASTLELLLSSYGESLTPDEQVDIRAARDELRGLTRKVRFRVSPTTAALRIDGEPIDGSALAQGLRLNVGEHRLVATAPGYALEERPIRVASGHETAHIEVVLKPIAGFVTIQTEERKAAIAIDGQARAYGDWSGPLDPGEHLLQIYQPGHETVEEPFEVEVGERKIIRASAGGAIEESALTKSGERPILRTRGWYGLGSFNVLLVPDAPDGVRVNNSWNSGALSWGGRAGYRLWTALGLELLVEGGLTRVKDACVEKSAKTRWQGIDVVCGESESEPGLDYAINAFRLGGNLRLFSNGTRARFTSTLGFGGVTHRFELQKPEDDSFDAQALNGYVLVEVGVQFNLNRLLLEADFVTYVESRGSLGNDDRDLFNEGGLKSLGFGLRAGWSEWKAP